MKEELLKTQLGYVGLFGSRPTLKEAETYLLAAAKDGGSSSAITGAMVYHNSFVLWLLRNYDVTPKVQENEQ